MPAKNLLVTRGSSEAIDVLIRAYCRAYRDSMITTRRQPLRCTDSMQMLQGIEIIDVPLLRDNDFAFDTACGSRLQQARIPKLVFICSPNNPTGSMVSTDDILRIVEDRCGKSIVVVDEAYIEFSGRDSLASQVSNYENLVVLRTLSKAQALAGARCGAAIANEATIDVMCRVLPPYSFPTPVIDCVLKALVRRANQNVTAVHRRYC